MDIQVGIKLEGLFLKDPVRATAIFEEEFKKGLEEAVALTHREVDKRTPRGLTSHLAESVDRAVMGIGLNLYGIVWTPMNYARRVEEGTPYTPNFIALAEWVRLKLGLKGKHIYAVAHVIRTSIKLGGQKVARWMFKEGFEASKSQVQGILDKAASKIIQRWNQP